MSCMSLNSSTSSPRWDSYGNSQSSQTSVSTAQTSVLSSPGADNLLFDRKTRLRVIPNDMSDGGLVTPTSAPLPADRRVASRRPTLTATPELTAVREDYFSEPTAQTNTRPRRENFDFFGDMPYEIKVQIFQFLRPKEVIRCSAVSKKWYKMCFDGQLWKNLDASEFYKDIPSESLVKILTAAGPFVRDLNLRGCVQMRERWGADSQRITDACRNLQFFSVEGCRIDRTSVHYFLLRNQRLVHINISNLHALNNSAMKIIAQGCPELEHLNVSGCLGIDSRGLHKVVRGCLKLKDLRAAEVRGFDEKDVLLDLFNHNTLERLVVTRCLDFDDNSLQYLMIGEESEVDPLTDRVVVPPRKLRHLDLSRCNTLTDKGIKTMAHNVPLLEGLQLSYCTTTTDGGLEDVLASTPSLTHLDLEEMEDITNTTLQNIAKAPSAPILEHLNISYCEKMGDTGMLQVVKNCPKLRSIEMDNTRISDLVLTEAAAQIRQRNRTAITGNASGKPHIGLRMVVYDCQNVNWTGVREVLSQNARPIRSVHPSGPSYPREVISLKCFYGYQPTVDEHLNRVLQGDLLAAGRLERKWAEYMIATEEAGAHGAGSRRRRRRAREAALVHADEEDGALTRGGRRRARSGGCAIM